MASNSKSLTQIALGKFKKNNVGLLSFWYIALCAFVAVFAYTLAPDNTKNANQMHLEIHSKPPGFSVLMLEVPTKNAKSQTFFDKVFFGKITRVTEIPIESFTIKPDGIEVVNYPKSLQKIQFLPKSLFPKGMKNYIEKRTFILGTDRYGRDLLSRILIGTRISFFIGFIAVFISLAIGISIGATAGYFGGKTDAFLMWLINVTWTIPTLLLVIAITLALGKGYWQVFIAVGLTMWVEVARVVRGQVMSAKNQQYVEAAKALGFSHFRIIFKHILPNILAPIIVMSAANFAGAILIESGLSFLGIGAQPPTPSWGAMIKDHYNYIILGKPYLAIIPGLAIMSLVMAFMMAGNALRDALDVKN
ncbi:MAG: ABC transporter permease [Flavobacteriales bacterium]|jgi:peptide/nickel transport system permease protein|nr:ABC transporter permease [Flavobacteriales bacterium]